MSYPHPRRVIHSYPQRMDPSFHSIPSSTAHVTQNTEKRPQKGEAQQKGRPAEAGLPARILGAESLHNNIVVTVSLSNARST
ncbi:hypothetical protein [uncultured Bifidobacterium sp.]|uniref:hypothetical protein n=1 Tax=uncultured Bifidobacterium sp. TaxID=165187 RepID=UPI0025872284|nr:hypothetical protein [uncultured Bifidobacterium sp.]